MAILARSSAFMWRHALVGVALGMVCFVAAAAQTGDLSVTDRVVIATRIYALVQQYFAHWEAAPRAEIETAYREYIDRALAAPDRTSFDLATMRFIAKLRNGHTQFFDGHLDGRPLKFRLLQVGDEWVVADSQDRRLPRGAVVTRLEGRPV